MTATCVFTTGQRRPATKTDVLDRERQPADDEQDRPDDRHRPGSHPARRRDDRRQLRRRRQRRRAPIAARQAAARTCDFGNLRSGKAKRSRSIFGIANDRRTRRSTRRQGQGDRQRQRRQQGHVLRHAILPRRRDDVRLVATFLAAGSGASTRHDRADSGTGCIPQSTKFDIPACRMAPASRSRRSPTPRCAASGKSCFGIASEAARQRRRRRQARLDRSPGRTARPARRLQHQKLGVVHADDDSVPTLIPNTNAGRCGNNANKTNCIVSSPVGGETTTISSETPHNGKSRAPSSGRRSRSPPARRPGRESGRREISVTLPLIARQSLAQRRLLGVFVVPGASPGPRPGRRRHRPAGSGLRSRGHAHGLARAIRPPPPRLRPLWAQIACPRRSPQHVRARRPPRRSAPGRRSRSRPPRRSGPASTRTHGQQGRGDGRSEVVLVHRLEHVVVAAQIGARPPPGRRPAARPAQIRSMSTPRSRSAPARRASRRPRPATAREPRRSRQPSRAAGPGPPEMTASALRSPRTSASSASQRCRTSATGVGPPQGDRGIPGGAARRRAAHRRPEVAWRTGRSRPRRPRLVVDRPCRG